MGLKITMKKYLTNNMYWSKQ